MDISTSRRTSAEEEAINNTCSMIIIRFFNINSSSIFNVLHLFSTIEVDLEGVDLLLCSKEEVNGVQVEEVSDRAVLLHHHPGVAMVALRAIRYHQTMI